MPESHVQNSLAGEVSIFGKVSALVRAVRKHEAIDMLDSEAQSRPVAVITGSGNGIGRACAFELHAAGIRIVLNGRRQGSLDEVRRTLKADSSTVLIAPGDIRSAAVRKRLIRDAIRCFGRLDILINNAGVFKPTPFEQHTPQTFDLYFDTLVRAPFFLIKEAVPHLVMSPQPVVINLGSAWAATAFTDTPCAAYAAAKGALHTLTGNLAVELAPRGIRVLCVSPGRVPKHPESGSCDFQPIARSGTPVDVARLISFLVSAHASWITGSTIPVDGGLLAGRPAHVFNSTATLGNDPDATRYS